MKLRDLLGEMVLQGASDLHIKAGSPPGLRVHGELQPIENYDPLSGADTCKLVGELLEDEEFRKQYEENRDLDFSRHLEGIARFRVNVFFQRGTPAAVLRLIPIEVPEMESMGYPPVVKALCQKPRGLCLVTGPTGSGKSTTLAAMIDYINRHDHGHILTLEDPIEFVHQDKNCFVNQREIGSDSLSFNNALRAALREDPDFILVGEMRDLETISLAITAAETGHLVFGTLHTTSAIQTVDRIIDVFPHEAQQQVRTQLSATLQGVISQTLLPKVGGGRVCAQEIMIGTSAVRNCVREGKTPQLINVLQTGLQYGMQTLESSLADLIIAGVVTPDAAIAKANDPQMLKNILGKSGHAVRLTDDSLIPQARAAQTTEGAPTEPPPTAGPAPDEGEEAPPEKEPNSYDEFEQFRKKMKQ